MKKWFLVLLLINTVVTAYWFLFNSNSTEMSVSENSSNTLETQNCPLTIEPLLGTKEVYEEQTAIPYIFTIKNNGNTAIKIDEIKPSCSCTVVDLESNVIEPGSSVKFKAVYKVVSQFGELTKRRIQVITDHADCSQLSCEIAGFRHRRFEIEPKQVDFGLVEQGQTPKIRVKIQTKGKDMRLTPNRIIGTNTKLKIEVLKHEKNDAGEDFVELEFSVLANTPIGTINGKLFIPRDEDDGIGPIVNFYAKIAGPVRVIPSVLMFGTIRDNKPRTRSIRFLPTNRDSTKTINIVGFKNTPKGVEVKVSDKRSDIAIFTINPEQLSDRKEVAEVIIIVCELNGNKHEISLPIQGQVLSPVSEGSK